MLRHVYINHLLKFLHLFINTNLYKNRYVKSKQIVTQYVKSMQVLIEQILHQTTEKWWKKREKDLVIISMQSRC